MKQEIKTYSDWYYVSKQQLEKYGGGGLLSHYKGSLIRALQVVYPHYNWQLYSHSSPHHVTKGKSLFSKAQYRLFQHLKFASLLSFMIAYLQAVS